MTTQNKKISRGLRNNNPGNIRRSRVRYKGESESSDSAFKQFESMAWGYRAMFVILHTYRQKYGLRNIADMISRYAPAFENHTDKYVSYVCESASISAHSPVDTLAPDVMIPVVAAMSRVENGTDADLEMVKEGWGLFMKERL